ncbi:MAG: carotenoid biosynthesis protein [Candidatus Aminicenantes bacterium]|nr:carotenoid biosynthesis protein [Candidatus Aminicenantes bacterium]
MIGKKQRAGSTASTSIRPEEDPLPSPPLFSRRGIAREFREHFPIWLVYLAAIGTLHATLSNAPEHVFAASGIPRRMFLALAPFPLFWFALYFILRIRRSKRLVRRWKAALALAALVLGVPLAAFFFYRPYPFTVGQMRALFEVSIFVWTAVFIVHILLSRGRQTAILFFGVGFVYGLLLENSGIVMGFFSEPGFLVTLRFLPAPLCTMLAWSLVLAVVVSVTDRLGEWVPWLAPSRRVWPRVATATAMALCLDAQGDPLASMAGLYWSWNELLPPAFFGVPILNFAAWFGAISVFGYFVFRVRDRKDWGPGRKNRELLLRIPPACFLAWGVCFAVMAVVEGGFDGPSFRILGAFFSRLFVL